MALEAFANDATASVTSGGTSAPAAGTVETWTLSGSSLPAVSNSASPTTQCYIADVASASESEKMLVTNISGTTATVTRGADGTTPVTHSAGFTVRQVLTRASFLALQLGVVIVPTGDITGAADTAAINTACQARKAALLQSGTYYITNLLPDSAGSIIGAGMSTILQAVSGATGFAIALKTPASTYGVTLANFKLIPDTGSLGGVQIDNTGFTGGAGETDSQHTIENVYVQNAGGYGFYFGAAVRSLRMTRCMQYGAGSDGFYVAAGTTDSSFTGCISGPSVGHSWHWFGWNNFVSSCKGFFAGWNGSAFTNAAACNWEIGANAAMNTFSACSAQNAALHGWDLQSCIHNAISGCESDGHSEYSGNTGAGVNVNASTYCTVTGMTGEAESGTVYGIQVAGTCIGTTFMGCTVAGTSSHFNAIGGATGYYLNDYSNQGAGVSIGGDLGGTDSVPEVIGIDGNLISTGQAWQVLAGSHSSHCERWQAGLAGRHYAPVVAWCIGDSFTSGNRSGLTWPQTWPIMLQTEMNARWPSNGLATHGRGMLAPLLQGTVTQSYCTVAGTLSQVEGYGYNNFTYGLTSGCTLTYSLVGTSAVIVYAKSSGGGSFTWKVDSGSTTTVSTSGTLTDGQVVNVTLGATAGASHTLTIAWASGGTAYIDGVIEYDADSASGIQVYNCGYSGAVSANWTGQDWAPMTIVPPALVIIELGGDDWESNVPPATFQSNLTTIISDIRTALSAHPTNFLLLTAVGQTASLTYQYSQYVDAMYAVAAAASDVDVLDLTIRMPANSAADLSSSLYDVSTAELTPTGHALVTDFLCDYLGAE